MVAFITSYKEILCLVYSTCNYYKKIFDQLKVTGNGRFHDQPGRVHVLAKLEDSRLHSFSNIIIQD